MTFFSYIYTAEVVAVFILFFVRLWLTRKRTKKTNVCMVIYQDAGILLDPFVMKKLSLAVASIVISLAGVSPSGAIAAIDGALTVTSSDDAVLQVTPLEGGLFRVDLIGVGQAHLTVSGDADLGDGVRTLTQEYPFDIYDQDTEADHFDLSIVAIQPRLTEAAADTEGNSTADEANPVG